MTTDTMVTRLEKWASIAPNKPAVHGGRPDLLTTWSWAEYRDTVHSVAKALIALGVRPGESVALISDNRPEWLFADLGAIAAAAVPAPIYVTNTAEQVAWVVNHSEARFVIADKASQYEKLAHERHNMPLVEKVIVMEDVDDRDPAWTLTWQEFLVLGDLTDDRELRRRIDGAAPEDLTLLCYTSGTTGEPKGVMITHDGWMKELAAVRQAYPAALSDLELKARVVSYLPLCHVAEHINTLGLQVEAGGEVYMCDDLLKVKEFLPIAKPTTFLAVPRVWEKFEAALRAKLDEATGVKAKLASWALATEFAGFQEQARSGQAAGGIQRTIANKLVISKIKQALGLDEVVMCLSGAAPLSPATSEFFASLGLPILEAYGMTETSALLTVSPMGAPKPGSVGKPLACVDLRIAEDGEIIAKGPNMTPGYFRNPEQTAELIDSDGWLHTGDVGHLDSDGYLFITDRKKDLFKTSGGKYVAPQMLEAKLKTIRGVGQAVAVGDNRKFIAALVTLDPENAPVVAEELGITPSDDPGSLARDPAMLAYIDGCVAELNAGLARYEQIKKVGVLPRELSIEDGELTPTLKLKRRVILANHADEIDALYAETIRI